MVWTTKPVKRRYPRIMHFSETFFSVNPSSLSIDRSARRRYWDIKCTYLNSAKAGLSCHTNFYAVNFFFKNGKSSLFIFCVKIFQFFDENQVEIILILLRTHSRKKIHWLEIKIVSYGKNLQSVSILLAHT